MQPAFPSRPALRAVCALPVFAPRVLTIVLVLVLLWAQAPHAEPAPHADALSQDHAAQAVPAVQADRQPADPAHDGHLQAEQPQGEPAPLDSEATREDRERAVQDALALAKDLAPYVTAPPTLEEWLAGAHYPADPAGLKLSKLSDAEKAMLVQGIMGTMEIARPLRPGSQKPFQAALKRHAAGPLRDDMVVGTRRWGELKRYLASKKGPELLYLVNSLWNQFRFAEDAQTWGEDEYWAEPAEFARRRQGDCDDSVMAKYLTLRDLGFPVDRMRFVVGKLTRKKTDPKEFHVVLRCQTEKGPFILENNRKVLLDDRTSLQRFKPVYSFNEKTEWLNFVWE